MRRAGMMLWTRRLPRCIYQAVTSPAREFDLLYYSQDCFLAFNVDNYCD